jgi:hypothetical protein
MYSRSVSGASIRRGAAPGCETDGRGDGRLLRLHESWSHLPGDPSNRYGVKLTVPSRAVTEHMVVEHRPRPTYQAAHGRLRSVLTQRED